MFADGWAVWGVWAALLGSAAKPTPHVAKPRASADAVARICFLINRLHIHKDEDRAASRGRYLPNPEARGRVPYHRFARESARQFAHRVNCDQRIRKIPPNRTRPNSIHSA